MPKKLTAERLRSLLRYDPETGEFMWIVPHGRDKRLPAGLSVGTPFKPAADHKSGYIAISLDGRTYTAHRLAWLYMTGRWPSGPIDHADMVGTNNRWSNLRLADHAKNMHNRHPKGVSGIKGVSWVERLGKWRATI